MAGPRPTSRGSQKAAPLIEHIARGTRTSPSSASAAAIRKSQASARSKAAPSV